MGTVPESFNGNVYFLFTEKKVIRFSVEMVTIGGSYGVPSNECYPK